MGNRQQFTPGERGFVNPKHIQEKADISGSQARRNQALNLLGDLQNRYDMVREAGVLEGQIEGLGYLTPDMEDRFWKIISKVITYLLEEDSFYAYFYLQMDHALRPSMPSPTGSHFKKGRYIFYFNPLLFVTLSLEQMKNGIRHEILHIVGNHALRAKDLRKSYLAQAVNLAMDAVVNTYLQDLPRDAVTVASLNAQFNLNLKPYRALEYYAKQLDTALRSLEPEREMVSNHQAPVLPQEATDQQDRWADHFDAAHTHDLWDESDDVTHSLMQQFTKTYIDKADRGNTQGYLAALIEDYNRVESHLPWQRYFKQMMGHVESGRKKTVMRRHRRQPHRMDLRGSLRNHIARVAIALDSSGSISDAQFREALQESLYILRSYEYDLQVIECDNEVRRVYSLRSMKDLKPRLEGRGGTAFSPVIEYCNKASIDMLIYFTDGEGENRLHPAPKNYRLLWVLTKDKGSLSLAHSYGPVTQLEVPRGQDVVDVDEEVERINNRGGFSMANQE